MPEAASGRSSGRGRCRRSKDSGRGRVPDAGESFRAQEKPERPPTGAALVKRRQARRREGTEPSSDRRERSLRFIVAAGWAGDGEAARDLEERSGKFISRR